MFKIGEATMKDESADSTELKHELVRLQRQYRYLADDRKAYRNETEHNLKRQGQVIAGLLQEESDMLKDLNLVQMKTDQTSDAKNLSALKQLLDEEEVIKQELQEEIEKMRMRDDDIKKQQIKIERLIKDVIGGCYDHDKRIKSSQKSIRTMENRLHKATIKFNQILTRNSAHRQNIEYIAVQRSRFTDLEKKLNKVYQQGIQERDKLTNSSKSLYTAREEADHRMKYLKEKSERDLASFNSELKDLVRIIDHDKKLRDFMKTKEADLSGIYEQAVQERRDKKSANNVKMLQSEVEHYDVIFKRLIEVSGDTDVGAMVEKFIQTEDMNFAMFNFVNEQNMQCKQLQTEIERLKTETVAMSNFCGSMTKERKKIHKEIEEEYQKVSDRKIQSSKSYKKAKKILVEAQELIWRLFKKLSCESTGIHDILGNSEISEENMLQFLGVIERRTNELLQIKLLIAVKENNEHEIAQLQAARNEQKAKDQKPFMTPSVIVETLDSASNARAPKRAQNNQGMMLQPLQEDEAVSRATLSMSRLALQQEL